MGSGASTQRPSFTPVQVALAAARITSMLRARAARLGTWKRVETALAVAMDTARAANVSDELRDAVARAVALKLPAANAVLVEARRLLLKLEAACTALHHRLQPREDEMDEYMRKMAMLQIRYQRRSEALASASVGSEQANPLSGIEERELLCDQGHPLRRAKVAIAGHVCPFCAQQGGVGMQMWTCSDPAACVYSVCDGCYRARVRRKVQGAPASTTAAVAVAVTAGRGTAMLTAAAGGGGTAATATAEAQWEQLGGDVPSAATEVVCRNGHALAPFFPTAVRPQPPGYTAGKAVLCAQCRDIHKPLQNETSWLHCAQCCCDLCKDCGAAQRGQRAFDCDADTFTANAFSVSFRTAVLAQTNADGRPPQRQRH